jgi:hypothetical protein
LIKKSRYKNIIIKILTLTLNTTPIYHINKKSGALYVKKNLEIIKKKFFDIKNNPYPREDKSNNK